MALTVSVIISYNDLSAGQSFHFPVRLFITLAIFTYCIWQVNRFAYRFLDKKITFYDNDGKRLALQLITCFGATWGTFTLLYFLNLFILNRSIADFSFSNFLFFLGIATGISLLINAFYIIRYLQSSLLYKEAISTEKMNAMIASMEANNTLPVTDTAAVTASNKSISMIVESGSKTISVPFSEMAYWFSSDGIVILVLTDGKKVTTNFSSFAVFSGKLPDDTFFQLSRQFITHLQSIVSITDDSNRKLIVELLAIKSVSKKELVTVSRYRSQELKQWFAAKAIQ
ncbi:MAG: LytTR family transcriptional regulator [Chitinophagaceae bacterium]|nr:LytTR family transcriptional regulator [Chitinophagaceae bacterium]